MKIRHISNSFSYDMPATLEVYTYDNEKGMQEVKNFMIFWQFKFRWILQKRVLFFQILLIFQKNFEPIVWIKYWGKRRTYLNGSVYQIERILDTLLAQIFSGTCPRSCSRIGLGGCWGLGGQTRNSTQGTWKVTKKTC